MNWEGLAEQVCRDVLGPELAAPVYVLEASAVPEHLWRPGLCGITSDLHDALLAQTLRAAGRWRGRGFACIVGSTRGGRPMSPREKVCVCLHELGHHLIVLASGSVVLERTLEELAPLLVPPSRPVDQAAIDRAIGPRPAWRDHEADFIRACGHVAHRATCTSGFPATLSDLGAAGPLYGLSQPQAYAMALGDELRDCEGEGLLEVLRRPAPARFTALFVRDIAKVAA